MEFIALTEYPLVGPCKALERNITHTLGKGLVSRPMKSFIYSPKRDAVFVLII